MNYKQEHIINKVILDVETNSKTVAYELKDNLDMFLKNEILPYLENYFDDTSERFPGKIIQIDQLSVEINTKKTTDYIALKSKTKEILTEALGNILKQPIIKTNEHVRVLDLEESNTNTIIHFLKTGTLPWWDKSKRLSLEILLQEALDNEKSFSTALRKILIQSIVQERLVKQFSTAQVLSILKTVFREHVELFTLVNSQLYVDNLKTLSSSSQQLIWKTLIQYSVTSNEHVIEETVEKLVSETLKRSKKNSLTTNESRTIVILLAATYQTITKAVLSQSNLLSIKTKTIVNALDNKVFKRITTHTKGAKHDEAKRTEHLKSVSNNLNIKLSTLNKETERTINLKDDHQDSAVNSNSKNDTKEQSYPEDLNEYRGNPSVAESTSEAALDEVTQIEDRIKSSTRNEVDNKVAKEDNNEKEPSEKAALNKEEDNVAKESLIKRHLDPENKERKSETSSIINEQHSKNKALNENTKNEEIDQPTKLNEPLEKRSNLKINEDSKQQHLSEDSNNNIERKQEREIITTVTKAIDKEFDIDQSMNIEEEYYIKNAGLIIIHPYLKHFLQNCDLLANDGSILDIDTAVQALHYTATKMENQPESEMVFEKFMCGVPISTIIDRNIILSDHIKNQSEELLKAVLQNWEALKSASPDLLRNEFLQRLGKISFKEANPKLFVERKTQDILLDRLPWNIGISKLPWSQQLLFTSW